MRLKVAAFAAACLLPAVPASAAEMIGDFESSFAASAASIFEVTADAPDDGTGLLRDVLLDSSGTATFDAEVPLQDSGLAFDVAAGGLVDVPLAAGAVPEPDTWAMLIAGFGAVGASVRLARRRRSLAAI